MRVFPPILLRNVVTTRFYLFFACFCYRNAYSIENDGALDTVDFEKYSLLRVSYHLTAQLPRQFADNLQIISR